MSTKAILEGYPSIKFLQARATEIFRKEFGSSPSFPGYQCDLSWSSEPVIDVILFGDAAYSLLNHYLWPRGHKFRLWVLNESFREALCRTIGIPEDSISVIPRELFLKRKRKPRPFPDDKKELIFVFSARTRVSKHFHLIAHLVNHLQHNFLGDKINFYVFTPRTGQRDLVKKFPELNWINEPELLGDKGFNWISQAPENSIFINFSIDPLDDFNVSCAQAQELGWPLIVADRGPYRDIKKNNVIYVPLELLRPAKGKIHKKQLEDLSFHILAHWHSPVSEKRGDPVLLRPKVISLEEIQKYVATMPEALKNQLRTYPDYETLWDREIFKLWNL